MAQKEAKMEEPTPEPLTADNVKSTVQEAFAQAVWTDDDAQKEKKKPTLAEKMAA